MTITSPKLQGCPICWAYFPHQQKTSCCGNQGGLRQSRRTSCWANQFVHNSIFLERLEGSTVNLDWRPPALLLCGKGPNRVSNYQYRQYRPQKVSKRFVWTNVKSKTISWYALPSPPRANCFINDFSRRRHRHLFGHKRKQEKRRTRPGHRAQPQSSGARPVSVARAGQNGLRTTAGQEKGQEKDKRRTRPGHRASQCGQLYFSKIEPQQQTVWGKIQTDRFASAPVIDSHRLNSSEMNCVCATKVG